LAKAGDVVKIIFKNKLKRRKELVNLSIEKKIMILLQLQKTAIPIYRQRGIHKDLWKI